MSHKGETVKRVLRLAVVVLACLAQIACTSFRVVADSQAASASALGSTEPPLAPKDVVLITTTDGKRQELRVIAIDANSITGTTDGATDPIVIPVDQVQRIERSEVDGTKVLRNAFVYVVVAVILGYALGRAMASKFTSAGS
ncbi:MAG: hypothetical protein AB7F38_00150 [Piscinibacter sp.]